MLVVEDREALAARRVDQRVVGAEHFVLVGRRDLRGETLLDEKLGGGSASNSAHTAERDVDGLDHFVTDLASRAVEQIGGVRVGVASGRANAVLEALLGERMGDLSLLRVAGGGAWRNGVRQRDRIGAAEPSRRDGPAET